MSVELKQGDGVQAPPAFKLSKKKQALFSVIIFLVFLLLLEGLLRLLGIPPDGADLKNSGGIARKAENSIGYQYMPGWSGYHAGGLVHINSAGWRGPEFSPDKPAGTIRILGVGDSFTFGRAVDDEDIFLVKLGQMLNGEGGPRYETINAGHENVNTVKELRYFKEREMMKLRPDAVVLGFTVHNDAQEVKNRAMFRRHKRRASWLLRLNESDKAEELSESIHLVRILRAGIEWAYKDELSDIYYNIVLSNYEEGSRSWENCRNALLGFYEVCRANNTPLIFALFPVYTREMNQTYRDYPEDFKKVHEQLKSVFAGKDGVVVVDMLDDLAASGLTIREIRVAGDGHPNKVWHEIVARRLHETIKGLNLKPQ
jgi:hypothetical protein